MSEQGKVALYCAGGTGANIGTQFVDLAAMAQKGFASLVPYFLDTSRSNLAPGIAADSVYIVKGASERDGSGMKRNENYESIRESVKDMLLKHKPLDMNVVVFSLAGGTGSVTGPLVARELLLRGHAVIVIAIGSDESVKAARNTMDTLESLDGIAASVGRPLPIFYRHNQRSRPQGDVDGAVIQTIAQICILASRQINSLDVSDVFNFLNYDRVTDVKASVASFEVYTNDTEDLKGSRPVTMISIYPDKNAPRLEAVPDYLVTGYGEINLNGSTEAHYVIEVDKPARWYSAIKNTIAQLEEAAAARPQQTRLSTGSSNTDDFGMKV